MNTKELKKALAANCGTRDLSTSEILFNDHDRSIL